MNRTWRSRIACLTLLIHAGTGFGKVYVVKPGDTLSEVVHTQLGGPIYGKKGKLNQVLKLNPDIKNSGLIRPGQNVKLDDEADAPAVAEEPAPQPVAAESQPAPAGAAPTAEDKAAEPLAAEEPTASSAERNGTKAMLGMDLDLLVGKTSIEATSTDKQFKATPDSRLNQGVQLRGYYLFNRDARLGLELGALKSEFSESSDHRMSEASKNLKRLALFYHQIWAERVHAEVGLGTEQVYFLSRVDATQFILDPIFVDFLRLTLGYDLIQTTDWRWNLAVLGKLNGSSDGSAADVNSGHSYGAESGLSWRIDDDFYINGTLQFERRVQDSTQATQRNNELLGKLGITLFL